MTRGDPGVNKLDGACKEHDIAYSKHKDTENRHIADTKLQYEAMKRLVAGDSSFGERATALGIAAAMKAKRELTKVGGGLNRKKKCCKKSVTIAYLVKNAKTSIKRAKPDDIESAIKVAVAAVKKIKKGKRVKKPRIIKLPTYSGGVLPLIPIFAGLSALGSIVGSATGIISAINRVKSAEKSLQEDRRHNETMESIASGKKIGNGFYLHADKTGNGFYLASHQKNL